MGILEELKLDLDLLTSKYFHPDAAVRRLYLSSAKLPEGERTRQRALFFVWDGDAIWYDKARMMAYQLIMTAGDGGRPATGIRTSVLRVLNNNNDVKGAGRKASQSRPQDHPMTLTERLRARIRSKLLTRKVEPGFPLGRCKHPGCKAAAWRMRTHLCYEHSKMVTSGLKNSTSKPFPKSQKP